MENNQRCITKKVRFIMPKHYGKTKKKGLKKPKSMKKSKRRK